MREIVINQSKSKQRQMVLLGIFMLLMCAFCIIAGARKDEFILFPFLYVIIGIIGVLFFGFCFIVIVIRYIKPKPLLIINDKGIIETSSATGTGEIAWDEIESFYQKKMLNNAYICVKLKDDKKLLSRLTPWKRRLLKLNTPFGFELVSITLQTAEKSLIEVLNILQTRLQEYQNMQMVHNHFQTK